MSSLKQHLGFLALTISMQERKLSFLVFQLYHLRALFSMSAADGVP
jgi:hypothetical protein